jgi:hypothetical protein
VDDEALVPDIVRKLNDAGKTIEISLSNGKSVAAAVEDGNRFLQGHGYSVRFQVIGANHGNDVRIK